MTEKINSRLEFLLRGTTEGPAVGSIATNLALQEDKDKPTDTRKLKKKDKSNADEESKAAPVEKINHYEDLGLTSEKTSVIKMMSNAVGLQQAKKGTKKGAKKGKKGKSAGKSAT